MVRKTFAFGNIFNLYHRCNLYSNMTTCVRCSDWLRSRLKFCIHCTLFQHILSDFHYPLRNNFAIINCQKCVI